MPSNGEQVIRLGYGYEIVEYDSYPKKSAGRGPTKDKPQQYRRTLYFVLPAFETTRLATVVAPRHGIARALLAYAVFARLLWHVSNDVAAPWMRGKTLKGGVGAFDAVEPESDADIADAVGLEYGQWLTAASDLQEAVLISRGIRLTIPHSDVRVIRNEQLTLFAPNPPSTMGRSLPGTSPGDDRPPATSAGAAATSAAAANATSAFGNSAPNCANSAPNCIARNGGIKREHKRDVTQSNEFPAAATSAAESAAPRLVSSRSFPEDRKAPEEDSRLSADLAATFDSIRAKLRARDAPPATEPAAETCGHEPRFSEHETRDVDLLRGELRSLVQIGAQDRARIVFVQIANAVLCSAVGSATDLRYFGQAFAAAWADMGSRARRLDELVRDAIRIAGEGRDQGGAIDDPVRYWTAEARRKLGLRKAEKVRSIDGVLTVDHQALKAKACEG